MKAGRPINQAVWAPRLQQAKEIAASYGTLTDIAKAWGTSVPYACRVLKDREAGLHREIVENASRVRNHIPDTEIRRRLGVVNSCGGIAPASRWLGMSYQCLHNTIKLHAPDGVEDALSFY